MSIVSEYRLFRNGKVDVVHFHIFSISFKIVCTISCNFLAIHYKHNSYLLFMWWCFTCLHHRRICTRCKTHLLYLLQPIKNQSLLYSHKFLRLHVVHSRISLIMMMHNVWVFAEHQCVLITFITNQLTALYSLECLVIGGTYYVVHINLSALLRRRKDTES